MNAGELLRGRREEVLRIAAKHGARNVRVFGSVARGEAGEASDVDLLLRFRSASRGPVNHDVETRLEQATLAGPQESQEAWSLPGCPDVV